MGFRGRAIRARRAPSSLDALPRHRFVVFSWPLALAFSPCREGAFKGRHPPQKKEHFFSPSHQSVGAKRKPWQADLTLAAPGAFLRRTLFFAPPAGTGTNRPRAGFKKCFTVEGAFFPGGRHSCRNRPLWKEGDKSENKRNTGKHREAAKNSAPAPPRNCGGTPRSGKKLRARVPIPLEAINHKPVRRREGAKPARITERETARIRLD